MKFFVILFCLLTFSAFSEERPNIIFFFTDDQSYTALGCMGNDEIKTPNMDAIGKQGVIFDRHYNTTAICMASRACVMTGMLEYKTGTNFMHGSMPQKMFAKSYPVLLKESGYFTGFAGKFGFPVTAERVPSIAHESYDKLPVDSFDIWAGGTGQTNFKTKRNKYIAQYAKKYPHSTRAYGAWGQDFITKSKASGKPFCMSIYFKAPHLPHTPDPFFDDLYKGSKFSKPINFGNDHSKHISAQAKLGRQYGSFRQKFAYFSDYQTRKRLYYQLISGVDYAIGMIRSELKKQSLDKNTIIIISSDNGYSEGAHGFSGKCLPYEEPSRAPLIIYDPRNTKNKRRIDTITAGIDITATILQMAGVAVPGNMDGKSLIPLLKGSQKKVHQSLPLIQTYGSAATHSLAIVTDEHKYIYWSFEDGKMKASEELYHIKKDTFEMQNVVANPEYGNVLNQLRKTYDEQLNNWRNEAVANAGYQVYGKLFNRQLPHSSKKDLWPKESLSMYEYEKRGQKKGYSKKPKKKHR